MSFITIVEDDERIPKKFGESTIWYRRYSSADHRKIEKQFRKRRKNRQGEFYFDIDEDGQADAIIDYIILELEKVKNAAGGFIETTLENKLKLPGDVVEEIMQDSGASGIIKGDEETDPTRPASNDT